jgi:hypothetical protein
MVTADATVDVSAKVCVEAISLLRSGVTRETKPARNDENEYEYNSRFH